jgi:hypothetical protein
MSISRTIYLKHPASPETEFQELSGFFVAPVFHVQILHAFRCVVALPRDCNPTPAPLISALQYRKALTFNSRKNSYTLFGTRNTLYGSNLLQVLVNS